MQLLEGADMGTFLLAAGLASFYLVVVLLIELARRKLGVSTDITRRVIHIFSGLCTILDFVLLPTAWFLSLITISLVVIIFSQRLGWFTSIHSVTRRTYGEVFLPLGTLLAFFISQGNSVIFITSVLVTTFADSFAGITSEILKKPSKVIQGSIVFFLVSVLVLALYSSLDFGHALLAAFVVTLVERYSPLGSDNATVPVATALLLLAL
jgi:dolichol kinase